MAAKIRGKKHWIVTHNSDGELQEGSMWESIMYAGTHGLDNLITFFDINRIQSYNRVEECSEVEPVADKLKSFHWNVIEVKRKRPGRGHRSLRPGDGAEERQTDRHCRTHRDRQRAFRFSKTKFPRTTTHRPATKFPKPWLKSVSVFHMKNFLSWPTSTKPG